MKTRVITAIVALAIFLPILYVGGIWIQVAASVLADCGCRSRLDAQDVVS